MSVPSDIYIPPELRDIPEDVELVYHHPGVFNFRVWHIIFPTRHESIRVDSNGRVWVHTPHREEPKIIDQVSPGTTRVINTLHRELVIRVAGWKDSIRPENTQIQKLAGFLRRVANSWTLRDVIVRMKRQYNRQINTRVDEKSDVELSKADIFWQEFYPACIRDLQFTEKEQDLIQHFSWEWKSHLATYPSYCRSWIVVSVLFNMVYTPKKEFVPRYRELGDILGDCIPDTKNPIPRDLYYFGGTCRSRTGFQSFAGSCMTVLPRRHALKDKIQSTKYRVIMPSEQWADYRVRSDFCKLFSTLIAFSWSIKRGLVAIVMMSAFSIQYFVVARVFSSSNPCEK